MFLNKYGKIVENQWLWIEKQYKYVKLDEYIIMPDHFHGIVIINDSFLLYKNELLSRDRSQYLRRERSRPVSTQIHIKIKSLSELIGAFKTTSSKIIHENDLKQFSWQRSFYDQIVRDENSLNNIRRYIKNNPIKHN